MTSRAYLSIGDVLTLLRQEFPDVTISKIRFLESQGLVNPERSPSGYRKFYEPDVERLRWVLRQQREHFLPLKVIRDRLAQDSGEPVEEAGPPAAIAALLRPAAPPQVERTERENGFESAAQLVRSAATTAGRQTATAEPRPMAEPRPRHAAAPPGARRSEPTAADGPEPAAPPTAAPPPAPAPVAAAAPAHEPPSPAPPAPMRSGPNRPAPSAPPPAPVGRPPAALVSGASMTIEELCAASGLPGEDVAALEGFGLIQGIPVAGILCYDEEALVVAKLVAEFGRYGIEPRHLRLYRNAVEREIGLIEQIVTPLLRQRNPEARQRAIDAAADLTRIGEGLRSSLLRREVRRLLGH